MARIVLVEAWYRGSHRAWADAVAAHSRHDVTVCTLPGVHWKWRMQGGAVALARDLAVAASERPIDALVATSAVDVAALSGLARRAIGDAPVLLYLHENQVTFPLRPGETPDLTYAVATWRSLVAADHVVCNSEHHRDELFEALPRLLAGFPDHRAAATLDEVARSTSVIGVGIEVDRFASARADRRARTRAGARPVPGTSPRPPRILWNHRWEHDKGPDRFVEALHRLSASGRHFEVVVLGSHLPTDRVRRDLEGIAHHVDHVGSAPPSAYPALVASCDIVVSTARHEFYGIAVAEAAAGGCLPVVPAGLAHVELLPRALLPELVFDDDRGLDRLLGRAVDDPERRQRLTEQLEVHAARWDVAGTVARLDDRLDQLVTAWSRRGTAAAGSG